MRFRGYRSEDVEAMYRLDMLCFTHHFQFDRRMMREAAEDPEAIVVVCDSRIAHEMNGFVIVHLQGAMAKREAYIVTIDVAPELRRTGIGSALLLRVEEKALAAGVVRIGLHVAMENLGAIHFYERQHYLRTGLAKGFYREAGLDAWIYAKPLV